MKNDIAVTGDKEVRDIPISVPAHSEFKNFFSHFWNMIDFPHHQDMKQLEPKIEVTENQNTVKVSAELPGVNTKDIDLKISSDGYLTISGEKKSTTEHQDKDNYFSEIYYGSVQRTIPLPWNLEYNKADAKYNDGVVSIEIPKAPLEKSKIKKINLKQD